MNASKSQFDASLRDDHAVARPANLKTDTIGARAARKTATKTRTPVRSAAGAKNPKAKLPTKRKAPLESKQDRIITLLRKPEGATLDALVKATGWQPHSIRGFLAGTIRKKLKLQLRSEKLKGTRTYRIKTAKAAAKAGRSRPV